MTKKSLFLVAASPLAVALVFQSPSGQVRAHVDKLVAAQSLSATVTVQPIGGSPLEQTIQLSKPNLFRWESPDKIISTNGKTTWIYDKAAKTYTEEPASAEGPFNLLGEEMWTWSAFFDPKFIDQLAAMKAGRARKFKGVSIKEVEAALAKRPNTTATLFLDDQSGVARGVLWKVVTGSDSKETIIFADKFELGAQSLPAETFAFSPPAGSKKVEKSAAAEGASFKDVHFIFMGNCAGCHGTRDRRAGLNLTTYESVMAGSRNGRVVIAGDPKSSPIMLHLRGNGRAVMPPTGQMPEATIAKIEKWIADGAKP